MANALVSGRWAVETIAAEGIGSFAEDDVGLDLPYVENWSFMLDWQIWRRGRPSWAAQAPARRAVMPGEPDTMPSSAIAREIRILFRYAHFSAERTIAG